jgi:hypothetical protein
LASIKVPKIAAAPLLNLSHLLREMKSYYSKLISSAKRNEILLNPSVKRDEFLTAIVRKDLYLVSAIILTQIPFQDSEVKITQSGAIIRHIGE